MRTEMLQTAPHRRTLTIAGARRRITLAEGTWAALDRIAQREGMSLDVLVTGLHERVGGRRLRANLEVFAARYFYAATPATEPATEPEVRQDAGEAPRGS